MRKSRFLLLMTILMFVFALSVAGCKSDSSSKNNQNTSETNQSIEENESSPESSLIDSENNNDTSENRENESGDNESTARNGGNSSGDTENSSGDTENASGDTENASGDTENVTGDHESAAGNGGNAAGDTENASGDTQNVTGGNEDETLKGTLALYLTDAATENYKAVYVSIAEVHVHVKGDSEVDEGWKIVATPYRTYNLLELVNGVMEKLGNTDLETGSYSQLRMILSETPDDEDNILGFAHEYPNYIITSDDEEIPLKVPSGYQTGIKLVSGFDIIQGQTLELVLDFDASRSVIKAGKSGKYLLKPTIKVIESMNNPYVEGWVTNEDGEGIEGTIVSAQVYRVSDSEDETTNGSENGSENGSDDEGADGSGNDIDNGSEDDATNDPDDDSEEGTSNDSDNDPIDVPENGDVETVGSVEIYTSTLTDDKGFYLMYLPSGEYNIVAYKSPVEESGPAFGPGCEWIDALGNLGYQADFVLQENVTGFLDITVTLEKGKTVSISARKSARCNDQEMEIEVAHMGLGSDENGQNVTDIDGEMILPVGEYTIVATTEEDELMETIVILEGIIELVEFDFTL